MSLADLFGCTFIVNLPERRDRRRAITLELNRAGMPLQSGKVEFFPAIKPSDAAGFPSRGVRGCFLSHLRILQEAQKRNLDRVLIVEDDLVLSPLINKEIDRLATLLQQQWSLVYLGHVEQVSGEGQLRLNPFSGPLMTSHFYGASATARDRLIAYLEAAQARPAGHPDGGPMHLDAALTMFRQANPDIVTLLAEPNLGWQRPSRSDIHSTWMQSTPVFREAYGLARFLRSALRQGR
jgi:Glycosyltransferase family 25 (LPS biosynthesis protein)